MQLKKIIMDCKTSSRDLKIGPYAKVCAWFSLHKTLKLFFSFFFLFSHYHFFIKKSVKYLFLIISIMEAFLHYNKNPADSNLIWWVIEAYYKQLLMLFFAVWHAS